MFFNERQSIRCSRKGENRTLKSGVSLVTVLLFMLVATIAATATYKWLTSEGRSSSSRLQKQEAYQSAMAGIENTRAWMTYSANDVGALIKQFQDNGKAIKLNGRLTPWLRANQNYDVWLTGVNTGNAHNFKLKVLSSGTAGNGTKHNEIAIFNVDGLYKVKIPTISGSINFNKAFQGKSDKFVGTDRLESGIVNGDFKGNQPAVEKEFLVTGSIEYEGAASMTGDLYVGENLKNKGATTIGSMVKKNSVAYVGGDLTYCDGGTMTVYGDMYVGGDISDNCSINVTGNLTVGGKLKRNSAARLFSVGKSLVFKENGSIDWTGNACLGCGMGNGSGVGNYTYIANVSGASDGLGGRKANLGSRIYLYEGFPYSTCFNQNCPSGYCEGFFNGVCGSNGNGNDANRFFSFYNPYKPTSRVSSHKVGAWSKDDDLLKNVGNNYWQNIERMNAYGRQIKASTGEVPTAILLKDEEVWTKMAYPCNLRGPGSRSGFADPTIDKINKCYTDAKNANALYNGFLILDLNFTEKVDPKKSLKGNFVFIMRGNSQLALPSTSKESVVMLYFPNGHNNDIMPGKPECRNAGPGPMMGFGTRDCDPYNYFIYSNGDIKQFISWSDMPISGSVILASGSLKTSQGGTYLKYNADVMNALSSAGFIMENPEYTSLVNGETSESGGAESSAGTMDTYFIANSPQLQVSLETQYGNNEPIPDDKGQENISSSFIVLPRIIYLPRNPYGRLADYFNVINLNGLALTKDVAKVSGCTSIPKTSLLYDRSADGAELLPVGLHNCSYSDNNQTVPFYIYVSSNQLGNKPYVQFDKNNEEMGSNTVAYVTLVYPSTSTGEEFTVKIGKPGDVDATWEISPLLTTEGECVPTSTECTFKLRFDNSSPKNLFKVETKNATAGTWGFQILDCVGCEVGNPNYKSFTLSSSMTVKREGLEKYCEIQGADCEYKDMLTTQNWPDCNVDENAPAWIKAVGVSGEATNNCSVSNTNEEWICGLASDIKLMEVNSGVPEGCFSVIPTENNLIPESELSNGVTKTLYGSLKAKKLSFHVGFAGDNLSGKSIAVVSNRFAADQVCSGTGVSHCKLCSDENNGCRYDLFAGDNISLTAVGGKADFSYWKCDPTTSMDCHDAEPATGETYTIDALSGNNSVVAWFGQRDKHCFWDDFKSPRSRDCPVSEDAKGYCFDYCENMGESACRIGNGHNNRSKWIVIGGSEAQGKIDYYGGDEGRISIEGNHIHGKIQSAVEPLVVMSTVDAGLYGTLRAQIQVPRMGREGDESSVRVNKSGFLLRSNDNGSLSLMLNVYADRDGYLTARACVGAACDVRRLLTSEDENPVRVNATDIVTLSAELKRNGNIDVLEVSSVKDHYGESVSTASTTFSLNNLVDYLSLSGREHEYVGISLADPDFKIYDIGWYSAHYNAECWDTYPRVKCSFRAAYFGGIVPQGKSVKPWVGLSSWFDNKDCSPEYLYNGDDAGCYGGSRGDGYKICSSGDYYKFTEGGLHGTIVGDVETKMAMAKVNGTACGAYLSEDDRNMLAAEEAKCGLFWVGNVTNCSQNYELFSGSSRTILSHTGEMGETVISENELFTFDVANLRSASLVVTMDNPSESEIEIYLRSSMKDGYYGYSAEKVVFSKPAHSTAKNSVTIDVDELANNSGFDAENVTAVIIRNLGTEDVTINSISSVCDYETRIQCKDAEYIGGKFKVNAVVKNAEGNVSEYQITATENSTSNSNLSKTYDCSTPSNCPYGDEMGRIALWTNEFNPYESEFTESKKYVFSVSMKNGTEDVSNSPCTTAELEVFPISGECRWGNGENVVNVQQGTGLPSFQYRLSDCPAGKCKWKVVLDGTTELTNGEGAGGSYENLPIAKLSEFNTSSSPFDENSEHTISLVSVTDNEATTVFNPCSKTFNVTAGGNSNEGALTCTFPSQVASGQQNLNVAVVSSLANQQYDLYIDGVKKSTSWIGATGNTQNFTAPNDFANHTYKITKLGEGSAQCSGEFATINPLECRIDGDEFKVSVVSGFSCSNCSYTNVSCGYQCSGQPVRNHSFDPPTSGSKTLSAQCQCGNVNYTCSRTAEANVVAPTVTCPTGKINAEPGTTISFTPSTLEHCGGGCTYWMQKDNQKITSDGTITSASSVSFTGESSASGDITYHLYVTNSAVTNPSATPNCAITVTYKVPTYTCPADMTKAVGALVDVRPTDVQYCTKGCSYTITGGEFADETTSGTGYVSGNLGKRIQGETTASTGDGTEYTLKLTNPAGDDAENCSFKVKYVENTCGCTCSAGCDNLIKTSQELNPNNAVKCLFATSISEINENYDKYPIRVNGKRPGYCNNNDNSNLCANKLSAAGIDKIDGGYYIEIPKTDGWVRVNITGGSDPQCTSGSSGGDEPGGDAVVAECSWSPATTYIGYTNNGAASSFVASNFSVTAQNIDMYLYDNTDEEIEGARASSFYTNNVYTYAVPTAFGHKGTYKYTLKDADGSKICDAELTVSVPTATCTVTPSTITLGNSATFSVGSNGWSPAAMSYTNLNLYVDNETTALESWSSVYGNNSISKSYTPTTTGTHTFTLKGFADDETLCTTTVTVNPSGETTTTEITFVYGGDEQALSAGTWAVHSDNGRGALRCVSTEDEDVSITVDGATKTVTKSRVSVSDYIGAGVEVEVPSGKSISCLVEW